MSEIGGEIEFAGTARNNLNVTAVMSSWACQRGNWVEETCESGVRKIKKYFVVPVTFSLYAAGPEGAVGAKLWTRTKHFKMQYRPSDSPSCTGGRWDDEATATCYHGKAFVIKLTGMRVRNLPSRVIISMSYNTSTHGPHPIGEAACRSTSHGCPYDSLNVALSEPAETASRSARTRPKTCTSTRPTHRCSAPRAAKESSAPRAAPPSSKAVSRC